MPDTDRQMDADTGEAVLSTALGERLLRRRSEPLGVIDVRQPQQHYARTAGWVAQRFALLEHWKTRYGSDEDAAAAHASLVFAVPGQPIAELQPHVCQPHAACAHGSTQADVPQPRADSDGFVYAPGTISDQTAECGTGYIASDCGYTSWSAPCR